MQKGLVMKNKSPVSNEKGFTLIEVISVIVILGIMASVGVKKVDLLSNTADQRALVEGVSQLNSRETLVWTDMKLSNTGWTNDGNVFSKIIDANFGSAYVWKDGPNTSGGTLHFKSKSIELTRSPSTSASWGCWQ
jgi:prepilin-type N-terminal cleavage/methylation domain-containing protein